MSATTARKIGPVLATFVVANNMIGSGFFLLPATLAKSGGVTALAWLVCTVLAMMLGGAFARLARHHPDLQSPDDYVRPSLGRDASFLATTMYWVSSWIGNNAIAVAAFGYLVILLPIDDSPAVRLVGQVVLIWLMFALNLLGCYVHDMRLQFLEFFGRFYKEGGKAYRPLCVQSKYVEIMKEDTEK